MQNLLPIRLVLVGASTPVFAGEAVIGLANVFTPSPASAFKDRPDSADVLSLLETFSSLSVTAFTGVRSLLILGRSSATVWSEACLQCRLERWGRRGTVEDCSAPSPGETFDRQPSLISGVDILKLHTHIQHTYQPTQVPAYWQGLRWDMFTCVGWQVTLCDPIWQVMPRSPRTSSHRGLYMTLTLSLTQQPVKSNFTHSSH